MPELERIRLDADTAARPGALRETLERFRSMDRAVLIGTQMVAKGHHFPGVDLAAVVDADTGLAIPDFRAEERTFQLVTQLAGRSGRDAPGLVIVQTFQPDAMPFQFAQRHDVAGLPDRGARAADGARLSAGQPPRHRRRVRARRCRGRSGAARGARRASRESTRRCSALRRCCGCAAATAPSSSRRRRSRARSRGAASALLTAASPALRRRGLTAVVDVDPQSL